MKIETLHRIAANEKGPGKEAVLSFPQLHVLHSVD
jgi:hypothetical protein